MSASPWQLLILLVIVLLLFGTKRLRNLGSDLGNAVKGFKKSMGDEADKADSDDESLQHKSKSNNESDSDTSGKS